VTTFDGTDGDCDDYCDDDCTDYAAAAALAILQEKTRQLVSLDPQLWQWQCTPTTVAVVAVVEVVFESRPFFFLF